MENEASPRKRMRTGSLSPEVIEIDDDVSINGESGSEIAENERVIYDPTAFIRCHGTGRSNRAFTETKTQVWDIAFEPDKINPQGQQDHLSLYYL